VAMAAAGAVSAEGFAAAAHTLAHNAAAAANNATSADNADSADSANSERDNGFFNGGVVRGGRRVGGAGGRLRVLAVSGCERLTGADIALVAARALKQLVIEAASIL